MLETAIALTFAHLWADFPLQSDGMVERKSDPPVLALHILIVALVSWAALGFPAAPLPLAVIAVTHLAIDHVKNRSARDDFRLFLSDQIAHLGVVALVALAFPDLWGRGIFASPPIAYHAETLLRAMVLIGGVIAALWAGGYAIGKLMRDIDPAMMAGENSLPRGGAAIGRLERLLILMLVLSDSTSAIGFLIAAKSVLRFNEIGRKDDPTEADMARDRRVSEYIIIGTLASFAWALAIAFAVRVALEALPSP